MLGFLKKTLHRLFTMSHNENPVVPVKRVRRESKADESGDTTVNDEDVVDAVNKEWIEKLQQLLCCPVCYEMIRPTVDICSNGHSVCLKCRCRLTQCPICSADFVKAKNIMLAQIAEYVKYPCPNTVGGCKEVYYLRDEERHLKKCGYIVHRCKIDNCDWIGKKEELRTHVETIHQEDIWKKDWNFAGSRKFEHNDASSDEFGKLLVIEKELFWMLSNYDCEKKKLFKSFQYIGPKETAKKFNYQICLKSADDRRQFLFKSTMDDDLRNGSDVFDSPNCTVIDFSVLKSFSTYSPENKLKYLYTITRL